MIRLNRLYPQWTWAVPPAGYRIKTATLQLGWLDAACWLSTRRSDEELFLHSSGFTRRKYELVSFGSEFISLILGETWFGLCEHWIILLLYILLLSLLLYNIYLPSPNPRFHHLHHFTHKLVTLVVTDSASFCHLFKLFSLNHVGK